MGVAPVLAFEAPDGRSLRITVKALGDFSSRLAEIAPWHARRRGGPVRRLHVGGRRREKVGPDRGRIGITPIRALMEDLSGDVIVIYRVVRDEDVLFRDELEELARARGITLLFVVGTMRPTRAGLLSSAHLTELVPDVVERQVYVLRSACDGRRARVRNVRRAEVPPVRLIHSEKLALYAERTRRAQDHL